MTLTPDEIVEQMTQAHAHNIIAIGLGETAIMPLLVIYPDEGEVIVARLEFTEQHRPPDVLYEVGTQIAEKGIMPLAISLAVEVWMQEASLEDFRAGKAYKDTENKVERLMVASLDYQRNFACLVYGMIRDEQGRFVDFPPGQIPGTSQVKLLDHFYYGYAMAWNQAPVPVQMH